MKTSKKVTSHKEKNKKQSSKRIGIAKKEMKNFDINVEALNSISIDFDV